MDDTYKYSLIDSGDSSKLTSIVSDAFAQNPIELCFDMSWNEMFGIQVLDTWWPGYIEKGISCKCTRITKNEVGNETEEIIGFCLNDNFLEHFKHWAPWVAESKNYKLSPSTTEFQAEVFQHEMAMLEVIEGQYAKRLKENAQVFLIAMIGTKPGFEGKGIASNLAKLAIQTAKEKNFERMVASCTHANTVKILRKFGFQIVEKMEYKEYIMDGKNILGKITEKFPEQIGTQIVELIL